METLVLTASYEPVARVSWKRAVSLLFDGKVEVVEVSRMEATYDHIVPRARGGKTTWENVVICCVPCNQRKGARLAADAGMRLQSTPRRPKHLLIEAAGFHTFPPRLPEQPIFYPALDRSWAAQIARSWNAPATGAGFVTRFEVNADFP